MIDYIIGVVAGALQLALSLIFLARLVAAETSQDRARVVDIAVRFVFVPFVIAWTLGIVLLAVVEILPSALLFLGFPAGYAFLVRHNVSVIRTCARDDVAIRSIDSGGAVTPNAGNEVSKVAASTLVRLHFLTAAFAAILLASGLRHLVF